MSSTPRHPNILLRMQEICLCSHEGILPNFGAVPYHPDAVTNVMSLASLSDRCRVTFDSDKDNAFLVHAPEKIVRFERNESNLHSHKPDSLNVSAPKKHSHVQTVEENQMFCTPRENLRAKKARDLLVSIGSPSVQDLKHATSMNAILNLPITTKDVDLAEAIFGPDLGILKGKTTRRKPLPMATDVIAIPDELHAKRQDLTLCMDIMFVNEMPHFTTIANALCYRTAAFIPSQKTENIYEALDDALRMCNSHGFSVTDVKCDNEFKPMMEQVQDELGVTMHYSAPQAHIPEAERNNRTIKERIRATHHRLPHKNLPKKIMQTLTAESARKCNFFPNKHGISPHCSPRQIVHRTALTCEHCKCAIGTYVQAHDEPTKTNSDAARTIDAIYLRPKDHGHEVYDLHTERPITRRLVTPMPITPAIIDAIEAIATKQKQKGLRIKTKKGLTIYDSTWTAGVDYDDDEEDEDFDPDEEAESDEECDEDECESESDDEASQDESHDEHAAREILHENHFAGVDSESTGVEDQSTQMEPQDEEDTVQEDESEPPPLKRQRESGIPPRRSGRFRQASQITQPSMKGQSHDQQHLTIKQEEITEYDPGAARVIVKLMTILKGRYDPIIPKKTKQSHVVTYSPQRGIKKFQTRGYDAALKEMQQLHERDAGNL